MVTFLYFYIFYVFTSFFLRCLQFRRLRLTCTYNFPTLVITDPEDKRFDLEAFINMKAAEMAK